MEYSYARVVTLLPGSQSELRVIVLGSTGSIGTQTLDVIRHLAASNVTSQAWPAVRVVGVAAGSNETLLTEQVREFGVKHAALAARDGPGAAERLVREVEADVVVAAMVGAAGLPATFAAAQLGRTILLANKETLVAAGSVVRRVCEGSGARLLPIDSEHAALWQCLGPGCTPPCGLPASVRRLVLTASGGPFRDVSKEACADATPAQALKHPNWSMGSKITIDSATMMNKAFELIEAMWLFGARPDQLAAVIHPQSIVHAMVESVDGSVVCQMGSPDMRLAIQQGLVAAMHERMDRGAAGVPGLQGLLPRLPSRAPTMDVTKLSKLEFRDADPARWPALKLASEVMKMAAGPGGSTAGAIVNAANEVAVRAFLEGRVRFGRIVEIAEETLLRVPCGPLEGLDQALESDRRGREMASALVIDR